MPMPRLSTDSPTVAQMVESIIGCKWSLHVLASVRAGVNRPGAMVRATRGLSTKVLNERLTKMVRFGILQRIAFPEVPPRVEYRLTSLGARFIGIIEQIESLERDLAQQAAPPEVPVAARQSSGSVAKPRRPVRERG
ncbi:MAG: winged helix-turn-helix transcriptional regulator [Phycisphaerales bacterium]